MDFTKSCSCLTNSSTLFISLIIYLNDRDRRQTLQIDITHCLKFSDSPAASHVTINKTKQKKKNQMKLKLNTVTIENHHLLVSYRSTFWRSIPEWTCKWKASVGGVFLPFFIIQAWTWAVDSLKGGATTTGSVWYEEERSAANLPKEQLTCWFFQQRKVRKTSWTRRIVKLPRQKFNFASNNALFWV